MKKILLILTILVIAVISTACINNFAVQELNNKAKILMENGDYEGAINRLEASMDLDSTIFETHYNLGVAYIKAKKYDKAIDILTKAIKMKSDIPDLYYSLGVAQDSYAQELLDYEEKPVTTDTNEDISMDENVVSTPVDPIQRMTKEERKVKALELFKEAQKSYNLYLEKNAGAQDKDDINNQLKSIEETLKELDK